VEVQTPLRSGSIPAHRRLRCLRLGTVAPSAWVDSIRYELIGGDDEQKCHPRPQPDGDAGMGVVAGEGVMAPNLVAIPGIARLSARRFITFHGLLLQWVMDKARRSQLEERASHRIGSDYGKASIPATMPA